jgi:ribosomal-protein-alanine N-acetyltransferase
MEQRDLDAILALQRASPEIAQWTARDYVEARTASAAVFVSELSAECEGESPWDSLAGFLATRVAADEAEILNLAVRLDARRHGVASVLLGTALDWAAARGAKKAHLEARASNAPALAFYKRHLFNISGRRPQYYSSPVDDALLLTRDLNHVF